MFMIKWIVGGIIMLVVAFLALLAYCAYEDDYAAKHPGYDPCGMDTVTDNPGSPPHYTLPPEQKK